MDKEHLDVEWLKLMFEARKQGMTLEEVRTYIKTHASKEEKVVLEQVSSLGQCIN